MVVTKDEARQRHRTDMHCAKRATEEAVGMMTSRSSGTNRKFGRKGYLRAEGGRVCVDQRAR